MPEIKEGEKQGVITLDVRAREPGWGEENTHKNILDVKRERQWCKGENINACNKENPKNSTNSKESPRRSPKSSLSLAMAANSYCTEQNCAKRVFY